MRPTVSRLICVAHLVVLTSGLVLGGRAGSRRRPAVRCGRRGGGGDRCRSSPCDRWHRGARGSVHPGSCVGEARRTVPALRTYGPDRYAKEGMRWVRPVRSRCDLQLDFRRHCSSTPRRFGSPEARARIVPQLRQAGSRYDGLWLILLLLRPLSLVPRPSLGYLARPSACVWCSARLPVPRWASVQAVHPSKRASPLCRSA